MPCTEPDLVPRILSWPRHFRERQPPVPEDRSRRSIRTRSRAPTGTIARGVRRRRGGIGEKRWAGVRFWLVVVLVVVVAALLAARTLGEIERVFGL